MSDRAPSPSSRRGLYAALALLGVAVGIAAASAWVAVTVASLISGGPALLGVEEWLPTARAHPLTTSAMAAAVAVLLPMPLVAGLAAAAGLSPTAPTDLADPYLHSGGRRGENPAT